MNKCINIPCPQLKGGPLIKVNLEAGGFLRSETYIFFAKEPLLKEFYWTSMYHI